MGRGKRHICLELLHVGWYDRFSRMGAFCDRDSEEDWQASRNYLYDAPKDLELFAFHPIPLGFEPVAPGRQTCREMGAFQQWTKKQSDDPVFKVCRKEYKRRFA